jgi:Na+/melibiose symporter-like transporter
MSKTTIAILALLFAGVSSGFALCMSFVHYPTWGFIPPDVFQEFQQASGIRTVPVAIALGISSLVLTLITAIRGLPNVPRSVIWIAVILAAIPWVATPTIMIPIQERLAAAGPASELIKQLLWKDILLRSLPPVFQSIILLWAVLRSVRRS